MNPRAPHAQFLCALLFATTTIGAQDPVAEKPTEPPARTEPEANSALGVTVGTQIVELRLIDPEGVPVEEFVKRIAELTGEVYLFEGGVLEEVGDQRVKFLGTLRVQRGRIADTAAALLRTVGIKDSLEIDGDGQPVHRLRLREVPRPDSIEEVTDTFSVTLDEKFVRLSVVSDDGGDAMELLRIIEYLEGTVFLVHPGPMMGQGGNRGRNNGNASEVRVHFVGELAIPRDRLLPRASGLLAQYGFAMVPMMAGSFDLLEVIYVNGPRRSIINARALQVPEEDVEKYADWTSLQITTVVKFKNINATSAAAQTRPFFAQMATQGSQLLNAPLGDDGSALLLSGQAYQVAAAVRLLRAADQRGELLRTTRLVTLKHLQEGPAAEMLNALFSESNNGPGGRMPQQRSVRIVVQGAGRLAISGSTARVEEVLSAIETLDVPPVGAGK